MKYYGKIQDNKDLVTKEYVDNNYQSTENRITEITSGSTNTQYPSAKAVYDYVQGSGVAGSVTFRRWSE